MGIKITTEDRLFSQMILARNNRTCEYSGKQFPEGVKGLDTAHIYGRRDARLRHDPMNAVSLAHESHRYFTENPVAFREWLIGYLGQGHLDLLAEKHRVPLRKTERDVKGLRKHLREQIKRIAEARARGFDGYVECEGFY